MNTNERVYFDPNKKLWVARVRMIEYNEKMMWRIRFYGTEARALEEVRRWDAAQ